MVKLILIQEKHRNQEKKKKEDCSFLNAWKATLRILFEGYSELFITTSLTGEVDEEGQEVKLKHHGSRTSYSKIMERTFRW